MADSLRLRTLALVAAPGLLVAALASCTNDGGRIIGPSGIKGVDRALADTCQIPCETLADCERIRPIPQPYGLPFVWLACEDGICVDVECVADADCVGHPFPEKDGRPCVQNQCAPACLPGNTCQDFRDVCIDGSCIRQPEVPDPDCEGDACACFTNAECFDWQQCRASNICEARQVIFDIAATGRHCATDDQCGAAHFEQDMLLQGLNPNLFGRWGVCGDLCTAATMEANEFDACGEGFVCVNVERDPAFAGPFEIVDEFFTRTACLPEVCAPPVGRCGDTGTICASDADCASRCSPPIRVCRGTFDTCQSDANCGGEVCEASTRYCSESRFFCTTDADCQNGERCEDFGSCDLDFSPCQEDSDCPAVTCNILGSAGCTPSLTECDADADCDGGERCVWPWGGCAGVCIDPACAGCGDWLDASRTRACVKGQPQVDYQVRRPD